ncbi:MAG: STAS domain-containing protein [Bryobacteraceae bacterium]
MTPGRNEELQIEIVNRPSGVQLIKLSGPLTLRTLFEFQEAARHHAHHPLVIDAAGIPYMDSAGLGAIIGIFASCQRTGQKFAISSVPERVQVLFEMTGVQGLLPCFPSLEEAEAAVTAK